MSVPGDEQLTLVAASSAAAARKANRVAAQKVPAEQDPVARVAIAVSLPHLDRPFDYLVPAAMADAAVPGARVAVRFAGQDVDGFVLERVAVSEHSGRLQPLRRVVSSLPVAPASLIALCRRVADEHAGGLADVLRLAVPPRHAGAEQAVLAAGAAPVPGPVDVEASDWASYRGGLAFLRRCVAGEAPRAVWTALPGRGRQSWAVLVATAALTVAAAGRGVVIATPDGRDTDDVMDALETVSPGSVTQPEPIAVRLVHDLGSQARYTAFVAAVTGRARIVVGNRAAAYVPMPDPGLFVCWEDGDSSHREPRAPYPCTLDVLRARSEVESVAALVGSVSRSVPAQLLLDDGWARQIAADRDVVRERVARVEVAGGDRELNRDPGARSRLPGLALAAVRQALDRGHAVLVQVPRTGYVPSLSCQACRTRARCRHCQGPLGMATAGDLPGCGWCRRPEPAWRCPHCEATALRFSTVGGRRTAEELGRAFPRVTVATSSAARPVSAVADEAGLVVATPGMEPATSAGYGTVLLLDTALALSRPALDAEEDALRRWLGAVALAQPAAAGGHVVVVGDAAQSAVQALVRHDPTGFAARAVAERTQLQLPPAAVFAQVAGPPAAVTGLAGVVEWPAEVTVWGPSPIDDGGERVMLMATVHRSRRIELASALRAGLVRRSLAKAALPRVQVGAMPDDP